MQDIGTYNSWMEADGSLRGEGCGVVMGETEMATWEGGGVGHRAADGSTKFRGSIYYRSQSPKLSQLNGKCTIFEFDTDPSGKTEGRLWLWE